MPLGTEPGSFQQSRYKVLLASFFALVSTAFAAQDCPIRSELAKQPKVLSNGLVKQLKSDIADPAQVSGITRTDFDSVQPWDVYRCGQRFCVRPKVQTVVHQILLRPRKLPDGASNPRWIEAKDFPCSESLMKNFLTYECTIEHEKVHVVQREDAIAQACPAFVKTLGAIQADSRKAAHDQAVDSYRKLITQVAAADDERIPYEIEAKCQRESALREGVNCSSRPDWNQFAVTRALEKRDHGGQTVEFLEKGASKYRAQFTADATKLESFQALDSCEKKEWYFAGPVLQQENCRLKDGTVQKTFYEYNRPQRVIELDPSGRKKNEKVLTDARLRISAD